MKIFSMIAALAVATLLASPVLAGGNNNGNNGNGNGNQAEFGAFAGFVIVDGAGSFSATFAEGSQELGGQSFGKTEAFANATSDFAVGTSTGISFNAAGNSGSGSTSGSLVNGTGSAFNQTGGVGFGGAGLGGIGGAGVSF